MVLWVVEENSDSLVHRMLQAARPDQSAVVSMPNGTLVILITVGFIVCCVWAAPRICCLIGRICCLRQSISNGRVEASVIQRSLEAAGENTPHGMSLADRRDFISNVLVTRKVVAKDVDSSTSMELERKKSDLIISPSLSSRIDMPGEEDDDEVKLLKACTICLIEYQDDEEIYWSHNEQCNHVFHKGCIVEWLLRHNGCPCCRHNFLSLNDEEAQLEVENSTFVENMP